MANDLKDKSAWIPFAFKLQSSHASANWQDEQPPRVKLFGSNFTQKSDVGPLGLTISRQLEKGIKDARRLVSITKEARRLFILTL